MKICLENFQDLAICIKRKKKIHVFEIMIFFVFYWKFQRKSGILYRVHTLQCKSMAQY
jgi:hypothetical protein